ncbi:MAG: hypothetical protein ACYDEP_11350 [Acidimicrobiales bacterium]
MLTAFVGSDVQFHRSSVTGSGVIEGGRDQHRLNGLLGRLLGQAACDPGSDLCVVGAVPSGD